MMEYQELSFNLTVLMRDVPFKQGYFKRKERL